MSELCLGCVCLSMDGTWFRKHLLRLQGMDLAGIAVLFNDTKPEAGFSPALPAPQTSVMPPEEWDTAFHWNPLGEGLVMENFKFAIVRLARWESEEVKEVCVSLSLSFFPFLTVI